MPPRFEQQTPPGRALTVRGYRDGAFQVGSELIDGAALIFGRSAWSWTATSLADAEPASFDPLFSTVEGAPDVLLLGTGAAMERPPQQLIDSLRDRGVAVDFMDSRAAARTFNVLVMEDRRVAAALLPLA